MTEAEWLACEHSDAMLTALTGKASARKLRLLACATCRAYSPLSPHPACADALAVAERYADGRAAEQERVAAFLANLNSLQEGDSAAWDFRFFVGFAAGETAGDLGVHLRNWETGR